MRGDTAGALARSTGARHGDVRGPIRTSTARKVRGRLCIAHSYFEAGFVHVGYTKAGLWTMQLTPDKFPAAQLARGMEAELFA